MKLEPSSKLKPFVKEIFVLETEEEKQHALPFYADGFPGIMYSETKAGVVLLPKGKTLSDFFLYGQTIEPIQLQIDGKYKLIVFQLYPFATRLLLGLDPKEINDECYDLNQLEFVDTEKVAVEIRKVETPQQVEIISDYILKMVSHSSTKEDTAIKLAVSTIINVKGKISVTKLREQLFITERTFERRFAKAIGVTAKQFARIVQFSFSLNQLKESDYTTFTNIAYENGFADQSHFIRTFKKYTGCTPKELLLQIN